MRWKRVLGAGVIAAFAAPAAQALEVGVGAQLWSHQAKGDFQYQGDEWSVDDSKDGFGLDRNQDGVIWANFQHPVPLVPNLQVMHTRLGTDGEGEVTVKRDFGDETYTAGQDVVTDLQLDQTDFTLYYRPLDRVLTFDFGVNVKYVDGEVQVENEDGSQQEQTDFSGPLPMLYARAAIDLPLTGLRLEGAGSAVSYDGHSLTDLRGGLRYDVVAGLGVEAGYRQLRLELDDLDDVDTDMRVEGPYAGVSFVF